MGDLGLTFGNRILTLIQGYTTSFTDSARNISGREVGAAVGYGGCAPSGAQGQGSVGLSPPKADDDLLIQQQIFLRS